MRSKLINDRSLLINSQIWNSNLTELHAWPWPRALKPHWVACLTLKPLFFGNRDTQTSLNCTQTFFLGTVTLKNRDTQTFTCMRDLTTCMRSSDHLHAWAQRWEAVAPLVGDRALSPLGWATGPCRPLVGRQTPYYYYFFTRNLVVNLKKKNYI